MIRKTRATVYFFALGASFCQATLARADTLKIDQAIREALDHSPKIQKTESAWKESQWKKAESYAGFLPTVSASANYLVSKKYALTDFTFPGSPVTSSIPQIIPTSSLQLNALLPLFDGFASSNRYSAGSSLEAASQHELSWAQFQLTKEVQLQFYRALAAKQLREVAEQNVRTLEDHLKDVGLFKKAGIATSFDVLRVEVQVSEAKSELMNATDNIEISKSKLAEILGAESESRDLIGELPVLPRTLLNGFKHEELDQGIGSRKDIVALSERFNSLEYQESAASKYFVPRLGLMAQYQFYNNRNDKLFDSAAIRNAYQIGFLMSWNIFDGFVSSARSKETIEQRVQAEKSLAITRLKAHQDIDVWKRKFSYFCAVYDARINDIQKSNESVRLAREGERVGARTTTDILDAVSELYRAKAGLVNAQMGATEAVINLELAMGRDLYSFN